MNQRDWIEKRRPVKPKKPALAVAAGLLALGLDPAGIATRGFVSSGISTASAASNSVRGTVQLPSDLRSNRRFRGYWAPIESGVVPVTAAASGRGDTVVVLASSANGQAPAAKTVSVDLAGLQATPTTIVVSENSVVEFKNSDRVPHDLSIPDQTALMPLERLRPGGTRRQKFLVAGGYVVRCSEYPHIAVSVIVVASSLYAPTDERGAFKISDVPDGKYTLKIWHQGRWVHEEPVESNAKSGELTVKVSSAKAE